MTELCARHRGNQGGSAGKCAARRASPAEKFLQSMEFSKKVFTEHGTFKKSFYRAWKFWPRR
jgi:hypothetical protein